MDRQQQQDRIRKCQIEIPLSSRPPPYQRGHGPSLAPLLGALQNDSDAYIIDKRVLTLDSDKSRHRMYYTVAWNSLPAARVTISASEVLNYVSPWALEDFEYKRSLERDAEEEEEEKRRTLERARQSITRAGSSPLKAVVMGPKKKKMKTGRPSKAELLARKQAAQARKMEAELPPAQASGPSLSTPQKPRVDEFMTDADDMDDINHDDAISKQLSGQEDKPLVGGSKARKQSESPTAHLGSVRAPFSRPVVEIMAKTSQVAQSRSRAGTPKVRSRASTPTPNGAAVKARPRKSLQPTPVTSRFTPAGVSSASWPILTKTPLRLSTGQTGPPHVAPGSSQLKKETKKKKLKPREKQPTWEVKQLEGDKIVEYPRRKIRFFKVRWEGEWPPDENPTWEPESNLPKALVREYLQQKSTNGPMVEPTDSTRAPSPPPPRKYSSVAEAFEGAEIDTSVLFSESSKDNENEDAQERFLVEETEDNYGLDGSSTGNQTPILRSLFREGSLDSAFVTQFSSLGQHTELETSGHV